MRRVVAAATLALVAGCVPLTGDPATDNNNTAPIAQKIVDACLASPLFKAADGTLTMIVPAATLPVDVVNAGVDIVCANPAKFAALDAATADWVNRNLAAYTPAAAP